MHLGSNAFLIVVAAAYGGVWISLNRQLRKEAIASIESWAATHGLTVESVHRQRFRPPGLYLTTTAGTSPFALRRRFRVVYAQVGGETHAARVWVLFWGARNWRTRLDVHFPDGFEPHLPSPEPNNHDGEASATSPQ